MIKKTTILTALFLQLAVLTSYSQQTPCEKNMEESLKQTAEILNRTEAKDLWNVALNAPIIIVDHLANKMYFTGIENGKVQPIRQESWDNKVPLANSFVEYDGKKQVVIMHIALMDNSCEGRVNLLAHEIFHLHQNSLGIQNVPSENSHMDEVQGRTLLQMEMKALQQALDSDLKSLDDLHDALYIRAYRQSLYPNNNEDLYELNEGLAEYTGMKLSVNDVISYLKNKLNYYSNIGYTNAFGYATGAAYALLLDTLYPQWKQDKDLSSKGMIFLLKKKIPQLNIILEGASLKALLNKYEYDKILSAEKEALKSFGNIAAFEALLKPETSKLIIKNDEIYFTFNPNDRVITLNNAVLLRNFTIKGEWGEIKAQNIVRLNNWLAFYLLPPKEITDSLVKGDSYEIQLNKGWKVSHANGIYTIEKDE